MGGVGICEACLFGRRVGSYDNWLSMGWTQWSCGAFLRVPVKWRIFCHPGAWNCNFCHFATPWLGLERRVIRNVNLNFRTKLTKWYLFRPLTINERDFKASIKVQIIISISVAFEQNIWKRCGLTAIEIRHTWHFCLIYGYHRLYYRAS